MSEWEGMGKFKFDLSRFQKKQRPPTQLWARAEEISEITGDPPILWLRRIKSHPVAIQRAIDTIKEMKPNNKAAYFIWLVKKYQEEK